MTMNHPHGAGRVVLGMDAKIRGKPARFQLKEARAQHVDAAACANASHPFALGSHGAATILAAAAELPLPENETGARPVPTQDGEALAEGSVDVHAEPSALGSDPAPEQQAAAGTAEVARPATGTAFDPGARRPRNRRKSMWQRAKEILLMGLGQDDDEEDYECTRG
jgi:hypothetical protein